MQMKAQPRSKKSPPARSPEVMEHIVLYSVSWEVYERLLETFGDRRLRHTYLNGTLEIMSPLKLHEGIKKLLARMVEMMAFQLDMDIQSLGSTILRREDLESGLEPDECYYFKNEPRVKHLFHYDPALDPPPDLAIEVDVTHTVLDRFKVYASLGVSEVWKWKDNQITFHKLQRGEYRPIKKSLAFPFLRPQDLQSFLARFEELRERGLLREFVDWLKDVEKRKG